MIELCTVFTAASEAGCIPHRRYALDEDGPTVQSPDEARKRPKRAREFVRRGYQKTKIDVAIVARIDQFYKECFEKPGTPNSAKE